MAQSNKPRPWLIAAWPGMGNVAVIAAGYLVQQFGMREMGELASHDHFDVDEVEVTGGVVAPARLPRGVFFHWTNPGAGRDLIVFLGEAQPATGSYSYAHELLQRAAEMGVERIFTFASMASGLHPAENPKVSGVATDRRTLADLRRAEVEPLSDGQIGGLNGVVLGVAATRGVQGIGLLAEIPFFAAAVPNPKAARAALSVFSVLADIEISLDELNKHAAAVDKMLIKALEKMERQRAGEDADEGEEEGEDLPEIKSPPDPEAAGEATRVRPQSPGEDRLDYAARRRIEKLFDEARKDPTQAVRLKEELDRLGVFKRYEDRFLDLFRRAG